MLPPLDFALSFDLTLLDCFLEGPQCGTVNLERGRLLR
jgi:hypothetical protein